MLNTSKPNFLKKLALENCGVDDDELAALLKGVQKQNYFTHFDYKQNQVLSKSLAQLKPILAKSPPQNLHELRMVTVKSPVYIIDDLCLFLSLEAQSLRSLKLIDMNLSPTSISRIADMVKSSGWLEQLDLSKNAGLTPKNWLPMLEVLSKNRTLTWVNLSHNLLVSTKD